MDDERYLSRVSDVRTSLNRTERSCSWLSQLDTRMRHQNRKILLLIDNAPSHIWDQSVLPNVRVEPLDPNMTSHIQPMDAGIIHAFKAHYRRLYIRHVLERDEAGEQNIWHIDQLAAMRIAEEAWGVINTSTIVNCWLHSGIISRRDSDGKPLPTNNPEICPDTTPIPIQKSIEMLQEAIDKLAARKIGTDNIMKATELVDIDAETVTEKAFTDVEIMEQARAELNPDLADNDIGNHDDDDDDDDEPVLTAVKALQAVKELQRFALTQNAKEWDNAISLLPKLTRLLRRDHQDSLQQSTLDRFMSN